MGDDTNLPILCPQVRKTFKFKTLLLELRTGNYVVVTNLQILHSICFVMLGQALCKLYFPFSSYPTVGFTNSRD